MKNELPTLGWEKKCSPLSVGSSFSVFATPLVFLTDFDTFGKIQVVESGQTVYFKRLQASEAFFSLVFVAFWALRKT